jgi:hypothetical protein
MEFYLRNLRNLRLIYTFPGSACDYPWELNAWGDAVKKEDPGLRNTSDAGV